MAFYRFSRIGVRTFTRVARTIISTPLKNGNCNYDPFLKGLKEQGCDGPVTSAITQIENYINKQVHK